MIPNRQHLYLMALRLLLVVFTAAWAFEQCYEKLGLNMLRQIEQAYCHDLSNLQTEYTFITDMVLKLNYFKLFFP